MMEHIAISVIVPIYNTKPYLEECIESILDQKINVPVEVLLIDDGSTDGCADLCDRYAARDARVRVIHQENQGLSAARNAGIDAAKGRYYSFIDSDDVVLPGFLQTLYDACERHDAYMALCSVEDVQENGKSCDPAYFTRPTQEGVFCGKDLLNEFYTPYGTVYTVAWNKMYRAEVWKLLHYPEGRLHEDDFVAHRLFWRCDKVVCIDKPLYHYRLRNGSICRTSIRPEAFDAVVSGIGGEKRPGIVHRIDRDTSGLIIAAKNDAAHLALAAQLADHTLARTYECLSVGSFRQDSGTVDAPIGRSRSDRKKMAVVAGGRPAITHWEVLARYPGVTHLRCRLETGRTHQIRVHLAYIGHPILGDTVYGNRKPVPGLTGQCLHATGLRFLHPRTGRPVELTCPRPEEFERMLVKLQKRI